MAKNEYDEMVETHNKRIAEHAVEAISKKTAQMIYECEFDMPQPRIRTRVDVTTGKVREIGCECAMQQVLDIVAVNGAMEIFKRRIVPQQSSSIPGRGQIYGVSMIQRWVAKDNAAIEYARRHKTRATSKVKYFVKADIQKCYPSMRTDVFMRYFERDCGNQYLLWLWRTLLESHKIDSDHQGFMIGALVSQWAAQYLISFAYREMMGFKVKGRRGGEHKAVTHMCIFMDDMLLTGSNRRHLLMAARRLATFMSVSFGLKIKPNWEIMELKGSQGIDMMGYVVYRSGKTAIRARDFVKARRMALRAARNGNISYRQAKRIISYKGYFDHTDCSKAVASYHLPRVFKVARGVISRHERRTDGKGTLQRGTLQNQIHDIA